MEVTWKHTTICKNRCQWNLLYDSGDSEALQQPRGVEWGGRWEGGSRRRGLMYTYGSFMLMFGRNQQNSVKQLSFN